MKWPPMAERLCDAGDALRSRYLFAALGRESCEEVPRGWRVR